MKSSNALLTSSVSSKQRLKKTHIDINTNSKTWAWQLFLFLLVFCGKTPKTPWQASDSALLKPKAMSIANFMPFAIACHVAWRRRGGGSFGFEAVESCERGKFDFSHLEVWRWYLLAPGQQLSGKNINFSRHERQNQKKVKHQVLEGLNY